jgi:hypothetical protein
LQAHFANLIAEIARANDVPLAVEDGLCCFQYRDIEMILEVPVGGVLAIFHASLPLDEESIAAERLLAMNLDRLTSSPSFFGYDKIGNAAVFCRVVPLANLNADDLFAEILAFTQEAKDVADEISEPKSDQVSKADFAQTELWIRG